MISEEVHFISSERGKPNQSTPAALDVPRGTFPPTHGLQNLKNRLSHISHPRLPCLPRSPYRLTRQNRYPAAVGLLTQPQARPRAPGPRLFLQQALATLRHHATAYPGLWPPECIPTLPPLPPYALIAPTKNSAFLSRYIISHSLPPYSLHQTLKAPFSLPEKKPRGF